MTDMYNALIVSLEKPIRSDDAECIFEAIKMIRGVLSVKGNVADINSYVAHDTARRELGQKLWHVLYPKDAT